MRMGERLTGAQCVGQDESETGANEAQYEK